MTTEKLHRCYSTLNLPPGTPLNEVKRAYRALVKKWHPDRFHGREEQSRNANEKLKAINGAFSFLFSHLNGRTTAGAKTGQDADDDETQALTERNPNILYEIGLRLFRRRTPASYVAAFNCFLRAAGLKHAASQYEVGKLYEVGLGTNQDSRAAGKFYIQAARNGNVFAFERLQDFESFAPSGYGQERLDWYKDVASCGQEDAQKLVGDILTGRIVYGDLGPINDFAEAEKWFLRVAAKGTGDSLYRVGEFYMHWFYKGRRESEKIAFDYFLRAAKLGNIESQAKLGQHYRISSTFPPDYEASAFWYRRAAAAGHTLAMFSLASDILYGATAAQEPNEPARLCHTVYETEQADKVGPRILEADPIF